MNVHAKHSTRKLQLGLLALAACFFTGCWEEIHYAPPPGGEAARRPQRYVRPEEEVVATTPDNSLTTKRATPTPGEPASAGGAPTPTAPIPPITDPDPLFGDPEPPRYAETTLTEPPADDPLRYREPALPPVAAPVPAPSVATNTAPNPASNTRRVAWLLGSKLSLAALARDRDANAADVSKWFGQSEALAKLLGLQVDPLPATDAPSNAGIDYVFTQGQRIGRDLDTRYDPVHAALFELAAKSYVLIVVYQPHDPASNALAEAIAAAGQRAKLPPELFAPMLKSVRRGEPRPTVRQEVLELNRTLDVRLNTPESRS